MIGGNNNQIAKQNSGATIVLTDGSASLEVAITNITQFKLTRDTLNYYIEGVTLVSTPGSATARIFISTHPPLAAYLNYYVIFTDASGYQAKGFVKADLGDFTVSIVSTFQGTTQNWASYDASFNFSDTGYLIEIYTPYIGDYVIGSRITILDSSNRMIIGFVGSTTDNTINVVSTKSGSTQNWAYKHESFDIDSESFTISFDDITTPILITSDSITRNNCRLNLLDNFDPFVYFNGIDLSSYTNGRYMISIEDSTGKQVNGFISGVTPVGAGSKMEIASGGIGKWALMEIIATEVNHFYTGCAIGEFFISDGTETFDANNKAYWWFAAPEHINVCKITQSKSFVLENQIPKDMVCWLKGDTFGTGDGTAVSVWGDSSLKGNNFSNSNAGSQPTFYNMTYYLNKKGVVYFDGTEFLNNLTINGLGNSFDIYMVLTQSTGYSENPAFLSEFEASQTDDDVMEMGASAASTHKLSMGDIDGYKWVSSLSQYNGWFDVIRFSYKYTSGDNPTWYYQIIKNDSSDSHIELGTPEVIRKSGIQIGVAKDGTKNFFKGLIAEILIYKRELYEFEVNIVMKYLADKYAITKWTYKNSSFNVKDTSGYTYKIYFVGD